MNFRDKLILAPMVRAGTLPLRLLALKYGADIVYGEEIVDKSILLAKRIVNEKYNTIDFVKPDGSTCFRTCQIERNKVVFQLGTSDPIEAVKAAKIVENDVACIDVNMGCPKDYSILGGMGSDLLKYPEKIRSILSCLVTNIKVPITCKIRILDSFEETLEIVKIAESCGVHAIAIHGRTPQQNSNQPCNVEMIARISQISKIPIIANGGSLNIHDYESIIKFKFESQCSSIMIARAAFYNPSIFYDWSKSDVPKPDILDILRQYVQTCCEVNNFYENTKYVVVRMSQHYNSNKECISFKDPLDSIPSCSNYYHLCKLLNIKYDDYFDANINDNFYDLQTYVSMNDKHSTNIIESINFDKKKWNEKKWVYPKVYLTNYLKKHQNTIPSYETTKIDSFDLFKSKVKINNREFSSNLLFKNKVTAEHAAALVFIIYSNLFENLKSNII